MKYLAVSILIIFFLNICYSQRNSVKRDDSLIVNLNRTFYLRDSLGKQKRELSIKMLYDYENQYPYYYVSRKQIAINNDLNVSFNHIPKQGFIYIFSKDDMNKFKSLKIIRCDSLDLRNEIITSIYPQKGKLEYISFWYANYELKDFEDVLKSFQYTMGDFLKRTVYFLDDKLREPNRFWNLTNHPVGITFENNMRNKNYVIPIIIKLK